MVSSDRRIADSGPIFVASDLSPASDEAIVQAHERARAEKKRLIVCFVIRGSMRYDPVLPDVRMEFDDGLPVSRNRAFLIVSARVARCTGRRPGEYAIVIERGLPHEHIVRAARMRGASLIVLGARSNGFARHPFAGTVTERVVRHAQCPVLVARAGIATRSILVATDFSDPSMPALEAAVKEARRRDARLTILHSLDVEIAMVTARPLGDASLGMPLEEFLDIKDAAQSRMQALLDRAGLDGSVIVSEGPPAERILAIARDVDADTIFIGTRGRSGLARVVLGSVAEDVVRSARCSVFVVRLHVESARERLLPVSAAMAEAARANQMRA